MGWRRLQHGFTQERIVLSLAVALFALFAAFLPGFATQDNILSLVRSVSVLGILGLAMALVVIGRGIDLSLVATMAISVAWTLALAGSGMPMGQAIAYGLLLAIGVGLVNGVLIAYADIPALFSTLAMGTFIYGLGRLKLIPSDVVPAPEDVLVYADRPGRTAGRTDAGLAVPGGGTGGPRVSAAHPRRTFCVRLG